jgi:hypothetical protein
MEILAAIAFPVFIFLLPLLMFLPLMLGMPPDEAWLLRVCFPFLSPFSAVLWFIVLHRLIAPPTIQLFPSISSVRCHRHSHVWVGQTGDL